MRRTVTGYTTAKVTSLHGLTYGGSGRLHATFTWREGNSGVLGNGGGLANHDTGLAPMSSFVLIAPHHGADNASSTCFIRAVDPHWVIFPAGHAHEHR